MIQNLFNNINYIQEKTPAVGSNFAENDTKVDFQKLFEKQNNIKSEKEQNNTTETQTVSGNSALKPLNKKTNAEDNKPVIENKEESSKEITKPDETLAGGILYDIKELIAYINAQNGEESIETDEESIDDLAPIQETETTEETAETLDADAITKKLLHLEEEDDKKADKKDTVNENETDVKEVPADIETIQKVLNSENVDNLLKTAEVTTDEVKKTV